MNINNKQTVILTLLKSIRLSPPGNRWQFIWNKDNSNSYIGGIGLEFYRDIELQKISAINMIRCYSDVLNGYSISDASSLLSDYFISIIGFIGVDQLFFPNNSHQTVFDTIHQSKIHSLIHALDLYIEKTIKPSLYFMPLSGFPCKTTLISENIYWVRGDHDLAEIFDTINAPHSCIKKGNFPPFNIPDFTTYDKLTKFDSLFICRALCQSDADSFFKRMAGALSVVLHPKSRRICMGKMLSGQCRIGQDGDYSYEPEKTPLVPAVCKPIFITSKMIDDFKRLMINKQDNKRIQIALEFIADGWIKNSKLSFINNSIALDALFGINGKVKKSILNGIDKYSTNIDDARDKYELILDIRNSLLHGEYPNVTVCPEYLEFYDRFKCDPANEQISIINSCILNI